LKSGKKTVVNVNDDDEAEDGHDSHVGRKVVITLTPGVDVIKLLLFVANSLAK
jgi:hypothetical protein